MQKLSATVKKQMDSIKAARDRRVAEAEARARRRMANAKTKGERERAKLTLENEKLALQLELYEAQIATGKAKAAVKRARLEAGDLTVRERLGGAGAKVGRRVGKELKSAYVALGKRSRESSRLPRKRVSAKKVVTRKRVAK